MAANVRFIKTSKEKYLAKTEYDSTALYFCEDTGEIFKGQVLFTHGVKIVPTRSALPECPCAADGVLYYVADTKSGYMMSPNRDEWLQTIYAPVTDVNSIPEGEEYNVVTTVGAVRDMENAIYEYIDRQISTVESGGVDSINFAGVEMTEENKSFSIGAEEARSALGIYLNEEDAPEGEKDNVIATVNDISQVTEELKTYINENTIVGGVLDGGDLDSLEVT